jgi:hypothetical protein
VGACLHGEAIKGCCANVQDNLVLVGLEQKSRGPKRRFQGHTCKRKHAPRGVTASFPNMHRGSCLTHFRVNKQKHANGPKSRVAAGTGPTGQAHQLDRCPRVCLIRAFGRVTTTLT